MLAQRHTRNVWSESDWDLGCVSEVHHIDVPAGTVPVRLRPNKMPPIRQEMLQVFLERLVQAGVLAPGTSPWGFPLLIAKKPGRDPTLPQSYRLLADFRRLNELILIPSTPIPLIDDISVGLVGAGNKFFSLQDLTYGFLC